eukprot:TRINITY_DN12312_c0_g1_i1.p1 TRINITY_DN12312_c0_g1~~TRINITY_DN12312_c0_g1_i1.p1  ORF type:complete len:249 (-),score=18.56 TRINITY_DN12312_c0_g1_i1:9-662(-)
MTDSNDQCFLISEYVCRLLSEKCERSFIVEAANSILAKNNPTFDGWIFEADFLVELRMACQNKTSIYLLDFQINNQLISSEQTLNSDKLELVVNERLLFFDITDIDRNKFQNGVWLIPQRWNQGCYDAVQLINNTVRVFQVTRAKSHSLKLKYVVQLLHVLVECGYQSVVIAFVIPHDSTSFNLKRPVGTLRPYEHLLSLTTNDEDFFLYGFVRHIR